LGVEPCACVRKVTVAATPVCGYYWFSRGEKFGKKCLASSPLAMGCFESKPDMMPAEPAGIAVVRANTPAATELTAPLPAQMAPPVSEPASMEPTTPDGSKAVVAAADAATKAQLPPLPTDAIEQSVAPPTAPANVEPPMAMEGPHEKIEPKAALAEPAQMKPDEEEVQEPAQEEDSAMVTAPSKLEKVDKWWSGRLDVEEQQRKSQRLSERQADTEVQAVVEAQAQPPSPSTRTSRVSRVSSAGEGKSKHMTTSQLRRQLRENGIDIPEGATREQLEALLSGDDADASAAASDGGASSARLSHFEEQRQRVSQVLDRQLGAGTKNERV